LSFVGCSTPGANTTYTQGILVPHDYQTIRKALVLESLPMINDGNELKINDQKISYFSFSMLPDDARCCPTGKEKVTIDPANLTIETVPHNFPGQIRKEPGRRIVTP
jgi:hypothetical protein